MTVWCEADLGLPIVTGIRARGAKPIGGFGLVTPLFTNAYQPADLGLNLPVGTFTNHYRPAW